jgi:hypothetical protein
MSVHYLKLIRQSPPEAPLARYRRQRRDAYVALLTWVQEQPDPQDIADEIAGDIAVLRQLADRAQASACQSASVRPKYVPA